MTAEFNQNFRAYVQANLDLITLFMGTLYGDEWSQKFEDDFVTTQKQITTSAIIFQAMDGIETFTRTPAQVEKVSLVTSIINEMFFEYRTNKGGVAFIT